MSDVQADDRGFLPDLGTAIEARARKAGLAQDAARTLAGEIIDYLRATYGGEQIYLAKGYYAEISERDRVIYNRYHAGESMAVLCHEYDLTERRIRMIIDAVSWRLMRDKQRKLF